MTASMSRKTPPRPRGAPIGVRKSCLSVTDVTPATGDNYLALVLKGIEVIVHGSRVEGGSAAHTVGKRPIGASHFAITERLPGIVRTRTGAAPRSRSRRPALRWLTAGVLVVALAVAGLGGQLLYQEHERNTAARQALAAAQAYIGKLINFDGETIEGRYRDILDGATGDFKAGYGKSGAELHRMLRENATTVRGTITEAWVKKATTSRAVILMLVDQSVKTRNHPRATLERSRVKIVMTKVDGRWLASKVRVI